jgi:hypothetical protein
MQAAGRRRVEPHRRASAHAMEPAVVGEHGAEQCDAAHAPPHVDEERGGDETDDEPQPDEEGEGEAVLLVRAELARFVNGAQRTEQEHGGECEQRELLAEVRQRRGPAFGRRLFPRLARRQIVRWRRLVRHRQNLSRAC